VATRLEYRNLLETISAFQKTPGIMTRHVLLGMRDSLNEIQDYARLNHSGFTSRSHNLERSITVQKPVANGTLTNGSVYLDEGVAKYGIYQHEGTGLYGDKGKYIEISPKNWTTLRWPNPTGGGLIYAKRVLKNPGVKGDPFLYKAADNRADKINLIFNNRVSIGIRESGL
jgi:hypothetical protein